jgi:hypothetical protein
MESDHLRRQLRTLKWYAAATTAISALALIGATRAVLQSPSFDAVTVHRINLVDNDGTLRLVIANRQNFPSPLIRGKVLDPKQRAVGDQAVFMFYNRDGTEQGGFRWDGSHDQAGGHQLAALSLDQLEQNDNLTLAYGERGGTRHAGLYGQEHPDATALNVLAARMDSLVATGHTTAEKDSIRKRFVAQHFAGRDRFSIGYASDGSSVRLSDREGRLRLLMMVDSAGNPRIQFLDQRGHVTDEIPKR